MNKPPWSSVDINTVNINMRAQPLKIKRKEKKYFSINYHKKWNRYDKIEIVEWRELKRVAALIKFQFQFTWGLGVVLRRTLFLGVLCAKPANSSV